MLASPSPISSSSRVASTAERLIRAYYWATPLFLVLDVGYGVDLRIPFLDAFPGAKPAYYALGLLCAGVVTARPAWTSLVGYSESALNIALLIVTTWSAYYAVVDSAASDGPLLNPFTLERVTSLALSAAILASSHLVQMHAAVRARSVRI